LNALVLVAVSIGLACAPAAAPGAASKPAAGGPAASAPAAAPPAAPAQPASPAQPAGQARPDQVLVALDWIILGQHTPFYVALDKGYYAEQNIAAQIARGYGSGDTVKRIGAKQADFGFADSGTLVAARANDDVMVKLIAAIYGDG